MSKVSPPFVTETSNYIAQTYLYDVHMRLRSFAIVDYIFNFADITFVLVMSTATAQFWIEASNFTQRYIYLTWTWRINVPYNITVFSLWQSYLYFLTHIKFTYVCLVYAHQVYLCVPGVCHISTGAVNLFLSSVAEILICSELHLVRQL